MRVDYGVALLAVVSLSAGCTCGGVEVAGAESFAEADALFRQEPRWLGGDGAYSVDIGGERTLWLFGDSFVATSAELSRKQSRLVRNSLAVMDGRDPLTASMTFRWRTEDGSAEGTPTAFFADDGATWHWPLHGVRFADDGPLLLFLMAVRGAEGGLGFELSGWRAVRIPNPDADPLDWELQWVAPPQSAPAPDFDPAVVVGTAVAREGGYLHALTSGNGSRHTGWLVRWRVEDAAAGDLSKPEWWSRDERWVPQAQLKGDPKVLISDAGPEASLHFDQRLGQWLHVRSRGFGATNVAVREAAAITGPYSSQRDVFTPPESEGDEPFVYAAKAHPQLRGRSEDGLLLTYATNSFEFGDLFTDDGQQNLYWPRFVEVRLQR